MSAPDGSPASARGWRSRSPRAPEPTGLCGSCSAGVIGFAVVGHLGSASGGRALVASCIAVITFASGSCSCRSEHPSESVRLLSVYWTSAVATLIVVAGRAAGVGRRRRSPIASPISCSPRRPQADHAGDLSRRAAASSTAASSASRPPPRPRGRRAATPSYSGTFHSIGARLLREYAPRIGLDPAFTIHDREDSADLMAFCRHEAGCRRRRSASQPRRLSGIYSRVANAQESLERRSPRFPWAAAHEQALRGLFAAYVETKQRQRVLDYDDLLLYFAQMLGEPALAAEVAARFRPSAGRRIPGHQPLQADIVLKLRPRGAA